MHKKIFVSLIFASIFFTAFAQGKMRKQPFRIVGYYSLQAAMTDTLATIPFDKVTHLNLWFLNPDTTGTFTQDFSSLAPFVEAAHKKNVKVLFSIGGGSPHPFYHTLLQDQNRASFLANLLAVVRQTNVDGVDVDLEGGDIDGNYEVFVTELAAALHAQQKLATAAIAVYYKDVLTDKALAQFDFMNVMSYDRTGPWRPQNPGPHSTYAHAEEDLAYFSGTRLIPKEKLVLGVPFYGYGFGPDTTSPAIGMSYGEIVSRFPGAEAKDEWTMADGKILYYNGLPTMKQKAKLAKEKAAGVMIWQLKGDAPGEKSLLQAINDVADRKR